MVEGVRIVHVVEDEQTFEPAVECHGHRHHRLRGRHARDRAPAVMLDGTDDVDPLLDALGAFGVPLRDLGLGQRHALELFRGVPEVAGKDEHIGVEIAHEKRRLLRLRHQLHALLEQRVKHVPQSLLAVDDLDDVVDRPQFLRLGANLGLALANLAGAVGDDAFEAAAFGAQPASPHADEPQDGAAGEQDIQGVGPPRGVPRRRDSERVIGLSAFVLVQVARLHAEPEGARRRFV